MPDNTNTKNNTVSVSPFAENQTAERAYKKAERLALATYMVTNLVSPQEGGVQDVRRLTRSLLHGVMQLKNGLGSAGPSAIPNILAIVREILSLLDILHVAGFISEMNLSVLKESYKDLVDFVQFSVSEEQTKTANSVTEYFNNTPQNDVHVASKKIKKAPTQAQQKTIEILNKEPKTATQKTTKRSVKARAKSGGRRAKIIDLITVKGTVSITDVRDKIKGCSAKTIQREMLALVADGVLEKKGEKRWSTYSIAQKTAGE